MSKADLINEIAAKTGQTKKDVTATVDAFLEGIKDALCKEEKIQLFGFGTFDVKHRAERMGRNPSTNAEMLIPAKTLPVFKAAKALKDSVAK